MLLERGRVESVDGDYAFIVCAGRPGCARCEAGRGCGGGLLGRVFGERLFRVRAGVNGLRLASGDQVEIGLSESALVAAALGAYALPLAGFLAVPALLHLVAGPVGDGILVAAAGLGLGAGVLLARRKARRRRERLEPRILRRLARDCGA